MTLHWATTLAVGFVTAVILALSEPLLAALPVARLASICFLLLLFRSPLWGADLHHRRTEGTT